MPEKKNTRAGSEQGRIERIKQLAVAAMFADSTLGQKFVLKGGNALDLVLQASSRASLDVDLSMEDDFEASALEGVRQRLEDCLQAAFAEEKLRVFDVTLEEKPPSISPEVAEFWGGYSLSFKLIEPAKLQRREGDLDAMRRSAVRVGQKGKFEIDISKFEFCRDKRSAMVAGREIFVYSPEMLVGEKLRAICQQMPEYGPIVKRARPGSARARDFVDIHVLTQRFSIEMGHPANLALLREIFGIKRVPLEFLALVRSYRDFHRPDFQAVRDSLKPGAILEEFDFYFEYVAGLAERVLKALRNV